MRTGVAAAALLSLLAPGCAGPGGRVEAPSPPPAAEDLVSVPLNRPAERVTETSFAFQGALLQGGVAIGQAPPGTVEARLDGRLLKLDSRGRFLIGFARDAPSTATVEVRLATGARLRHRLRIARVGFPVEHLPSLRGPSATPPEVSVRRREEQKLVLAARGGLSDLGHWSERFIWPVRGRISGVFGSQRVLGGEPSSPHSGVDVAARPGTPVVAPAGGRVTFASPPQMSLEGNLVVLDHGYGLHSAFLHLSRVDVAEGDMVRQGQVLGAVGTTGRSTGPHLHWGMTWFDVRVDPALLVGPMPLSPSPARPEADSGS